MFVFSYNNSKFLTTLETCIRTINAKALDFDQHPAHVQIAALSTYKLTEYKYFSFKIFENIFFIFLELNKQVKH